jgi:hypothetical protein
MPKTEQVKQQAGAAERTPEQQSGIIVRQLVQALGRPAALHRVEVRHLWEKHYRVNVFVGADAASTRIVHSFFLSTDENGNIIASAPAITRKYSGMANTAGSSPFLTDGGQAAHSST